MKKITKSITVNAPKDRVWSVLTTADRYAEWAAVFSPDGKAGVQTDWQEGSKVVFTDGQGMGLVGTITKHVPNEIITFSYVAELGEDGVETETAMKDSVEQYAVAEQDGMTLLSIELDMEEEYYDMMAAAWDKALVKVKEMAEEDSV